MFIALSLKLRTVKGFRVAGHAGMITRSARLSAVELYFPICTDLGAENTGPMDCRAPELSSPQKYSETNTVLVPILSFVMLLMMAAPPVATSFKPRMWRDRIRPDPLCFTY